MNRCKAAIFDMDGTVLNTLPDLANGIRHVHVYTMNKPDVAKAIKGHLSAMLGRTF